MSDSSHNEEPPSDIVLGKALQAAVRDVYASKSLEDLTVNRIRATAEKELGLANGFFKTNREWKETSKNIIQAEVAAHPDPSSQPTAPQSSPPPPKARKSKPRTQSTKRASIEEAAPKKRRKKSSSDVETSASGRDEKTSKPASAKAKIKKRNSPVSGSLSEDGEEEKEVVDKSRGSLHIDNVLKYNGLDGQKSESEMSEVFDEEPKPKRKRKSGSAIPESKMAKPSKVKKSSEQPADANTDEIKRLQGWLIKCGIRKMWYKELAPYDTPKSKIKHLKEMLADAGMSGRYSAEKAKEIKEERELKADLEAVQEGAKHWGKANSEEEEDGERPKRRLVARGLQGLDFLGDDGGEETD